jgi:hypothetical protein
MGEWIGGSGTEIFFCPGKIFVVWKKFPTREKIPEKVFKKIFRKNFTSRKIF